MALRYVAAAVALLVAAPWVPAGAAGVPGAADVGASTSAASSSDAENYLFAGGGTNLTTGVFFPGTTTCDTDGCTTQGPPLQIEKGTNITFVNLDAAAVTNGHRIKSLKEKKNGKPLFFSKQVDGPDSDVVKTSHVKPGTYLYLCTTHFGMYGTIEVVKS